MTHIRRRKGNRLPPRQETPIVVIVYDGRFEGTVFDESESGIGVRLPEDCKLNVGQNVRILYKRQTKMAVVARMQTTELGDEIGLKLA